MDMNSLSWDMEEYWDREELCIEARRPMVQKCNQISGLSREEPLGEGQLSAWVWEFRTDCGICQPHPVTGREWGMLRETGS